MPILDIGSGWPWETLVEYQGNIYIKTSSDSPPTIPQAPCSQVTSQWFGHTPRRHPARANPHGWTLFITAQSFQECIHMTFLGGTCGGKPDNLQMVPLLFELQDVRIVICIYTGFVITYELLDHLCDLGSQILTPVFLNMQKFVLWVDKCHRDKYVCCCIVFTNFLTIHQRTLTRYILSRCS